MHPKHSIAVPTRSGLRNFAFTLAAAVALFFGVLIPWLWGFDWPRWPWAAAGLLSLWGVLAPGSLALPYGAWMRLGLLLNRVVSPLVLGLLFLVLFVPAALLFRLFRYDPLASRRDPAAQTYRTPAVRPPRDQMEKPY